MDTRPAIRLAELLGALSLVTDLARGHPSEEALRACLLATALAEHMELPPSDMADIYYATLLRFVGCTATSHEYAHVYGGNDIGVRARADMTDLASPRQTLSFLVATAAGQGTLLARARQLGIALLQARQASIEGSRADCEVGAEMARRFGLPPSVSLAMNDIFERWDGKGAPARKRGEQITLAARFAAVSFTAIMFQQFAGPDVAAEIVGRWAGKILDPAIADAFVRARDDLFQACSPDDALTAVVEVEPSAILVHSAQLDDVARGFAHVVDLKSPYFHGHSSGVAALAEDAARLLGMMDEQVVDLRRAGLLHDLGRAGVPTGIWEKPGPLSQAERELVRLHPYHSERILMRAPALAPLGRVAGLHHERLDGSGYPHAVTPAMLDRSARVLAAADTYRALTEERPHRPPFSPDAAARLLEEMPLDRNAVSAVLEAAGHRRKAARKHPSGLTEREIDVLRLLVRGRSEREIAGLLYISRSTVHTHVTHIYEKAGVSTRAGAAVFAMENDLIGS